MLHSLVGWLSNRNWFLCLLLIVVDDCCLLSVIVDCWVLVLVVVRNKAENIVPTRTVRKFISANVDEKKRFENQ